MKGTNMFSQNDEEKYIVDFFKNRVPVVRGNFLDIGAYNGKAFSNTHRLALNGWSGVCFEPAPSVFPKLEKLYSERKDIICDSRAIGVEKAKATFFDSNGDAISSFNKAHVDKWKRNWGSKFNKVQVDVITFEDVFSEYGYDFDFINVDVEATNYKLFNELDFSKLSRCKLFCIEHDKKDKEIISVLKPFGFTKILRNPENIILGRT